MTPDFFNQQVNRLKIRFGDKAFDSEFVKLIGREVSDMSNDMFMVLVDRMIAERRPHEKPLVSDFREMRKQMEQNRFRREVSAAVAVFNAPAPGDVREVLNRAGYEGCQSIKEAFELQILRNQIARVKNEP